MKQTLRQWIYRGVGLLLLLPSTTLAYTLTFDPTAGGTATPLKTYTKLGTNDPAYIVFSIINFSLIFLGTITLILVIASGFMWLLAGGEEEKIKKAKDILKGAVMGLVIVLASYGLAQYIFSALTYATTGKTA